MDGLTFLNERKEPRKQLVLDDVMYEEKWAAYREGKRCKYWPPGQRSDVYGIRGVGGIF